MEAIKNTLSLIGRIGVIYFIVACMVFQYRNPIANQMFVFRDFMEVITFKKLEKYQPTNN